MQFVVNRNTTIYCVLTADVTSTTATCFSLHSKSLLTQNLHYLSRYSEVLVTVSYSTKWDSFKVLFLSSRIPFPFSRWRLFLVRSSQKCSFMSQIISKRNYYSNNNKTTILFTSWLPTNQIIPTFQKTTDSVDSCAWADTHNWHFNSGYNRKTQARIQN